MTEAVLLLALALLARFSPICAGDQPYFVAADCFGPAFEDTEGVRCGYVFNVPLDRDDPSAGTHVIAVAQAMARTDDPITAAPVLRLQGGPGASLVEDIGAWADGTNRDSFGVVLHDYRGTGFSYPRLDCPEKFAAIRLNAETADPFPVEVKRQRDAAAICRARAEAEGRDLRLYDTSKLADDVEAIRIALGIEQWNLIGVSYGTNLAIEVTRKYPDSVRSVILDSVYPPNRNQIEDVQEGFDYTLDLFDQACPPGSACNPGPETIVELFYDAVAALDANPVPLTFEDPRSEGERTLMVDGADFANGIWVTTWSSIFQSFVPSIIRGAALEGNVDFIRLANIQEDDVFGSFSLLMADAVECRDRAGRIPFEELEAAVEERREFGRIFQTSTYVGHIGICDALDVGTSPDSFIEPIVSDIPILISEGRWDSVTPPSWGETLLPGLPNGRLFVYPGLAHANWARTTCSRSISFQFLEDPTGEIDSSCIADMRRIFPDTLP